MISFVLILRHFVGNFIKNPLLAICILIFTLCNFILELLGITRHLAYLNNIMLELKLPDGNRVACRLPDLTTINEIYEADIYDIVSGTYDTVVDIGANIGLFSMKKASLLPMARIISIEPDPENFGMLEKNMQINGFGNVILLRLAVGGGNGKSRFFASSRNKHKSSFFFVQKGMKEIEVEVKTLDSVMKEFSPNGKTLLKIDVEGAELDVLRGAADTLKGDITIIMEVHPNHVRTEDVEGYLRERGFETKKFRLRNPHIIAKKPKSAA